MMRSSLCLIALGLFGLSGCAAPTPHPDYAINVVPSPDGRSMVAVPPNCPLYADTDVNFVDNQPMVQFGCANARNLAIMVDQPSDLLQGRNPGPASGITTVGTMTRYYNNQTRGLVDPSSNTSSVSVSTAPAQASAMTGESLSAGTGSGASSSSSAGH